jgi:hypothetical protein
MANRSIFFLLFLLTLAISCEDSDFMPKPDSISNVSKTSLDQEKHLERVLNAAGFRTGSSGRANSAGLEIDVDNIVKLLQADSIFSSYTFNILHDNGEKSFSNLIIEEFAQGYLGFILTYKWETSFRGLQNFTGTVSRFDLEGNLQAEAHFENGILIPLSDQGGRTLQAGQCLDKVVVTTECTPSKTKSTATNLPNEHIMDCYTVTTAYYKYCDIPDAWGGYIIGGLGSGPIGSGSTGGVTGGSFNTGTGSAGSADDANGGNTIVPILNPSKPKTVAVIEPDITSDVDPERVTEVMDSVYNHIENPCLRNMVTKAVCENLDNRISHIVNEVFTNSETIDLRFYEATDMPATILGDASVSFQDNGRIIADVFLNVNVLPGASQEMMVSTVLHEAFHAYLGYSRNNKLFDDHEEMANDYVAFLTEALLNLFPNMSRSDAEALSWGGLHETAVWKNLVNTNPVKTNSIIKINKNHTNGKAGTKC